MDKLYQSHKVAADNAYKLYQTNPSQNTWEEYCRLETIAASYAYELESIDKSNLEDISND